MVEVQDIEHIAEEKKQIGTTVEDIADEWSAKRKDLYQQTGLSLRSTKEQDPLPSEQEDDLDFEHKLELILSEE